MLTAKHTVQKCHLVVLKAAQSTGQHRLEITKNLTMEEGRHKVNGNIEN